MPTEILACTSIDTNWSLGAGATRTIAVAKPDDDDTTYIFDLTGFNDQTIFDVQNTGLTTETINSVLVRARMRVTLSTDSTAQIAMSDNGFANVVTQNPACTTSYQDFVGCTSATAPSGGAWTVAKLNALQVKLIGGDFGTQDRCTSLTVEVTYTVAGGGTGSLLLLGVGT